MQIDADCEDAFSILCTADRSYVQAWPDRAMLSTEVREEPQLQRHKLKRTAFKSNFHVTGEESEGRGNLWGNTATTV